MKKMRVRTFVLPAEDFEAGELLNNPQVDILINERHLCAKDGVILLHIQYLENVDYGNDGGIF